MSLHCNKLCIAAPTGHACAGVCVCMRDWRINDRELISHLAHMCMACIWSQNLVADSYLGFIRRGFGTLETQ